MLHAIYKGNYTFYISTEDMRFDSSVPTTQLRYLFQFTNDMDGRVVYAYGQNQVVHNRYTKVTFSHNTTEDVFLGRVNFVPNGYWKYKVYEVSADAGLPALNSCNAPITSDANRYLGKYTITDAAGTLLSSGDFTAQNSYYNISLTDLDDMTSSTLQTFLFKIYDACGALVIDSSFNQLIIKAQPSGAKWAEWSNLQRTETTTSYDLTTYAPATYQTLFWNGGTSFTYHTILTNPETITYSASNDTGMVGMELYTTGAGACVWQNPGCQEKIDWTYPLTPIVYGYINTLFYNPIWIDDTTGALLFKGDAILEANYGTTIDSVNRGYWTLQGLVEEGKLYIEEPAGEEQVQYTQHPEPSATNYIYYGQ